MLQANLSEELLMKFLTKMNDSLSLPEQSQAIRYFGLLLFSEMLPRIKDSPTLLDKLFQTVLTQCFGERDPRNLIVLFRLSHDLARASNSQ